MNTSNLAHQPVAWWRLTRGDVNAIISQLGFNFGQAMIPVFLLAPVGISFGFSLGHFVPGFALGFLLASLAMTAAAVMLARKEGRADVTAHVYGNNVPAILAYTLGIMLPVYLETQDPIQAWQAGAAAVIITGLIKLAAAPFAKTIARFIPGPATMTVFGAAMYSYLAWVLLQRLFDQPLVGIIALTIVAATEMARIPVTRWKIPTFLLLWIIPLVIAIGLGYTKPQWLGFSFTLPFVPSWGPLQGLPVALNYLSVIVPVSIYLVLQCIASVAGGKSVGDDYHVGLIMVIDGAGTLVCGLCGSTISPVVMAMLPPYKGFGARIGFAFWTAIIFFVVVVSGLTATIAGLFPWPVVSSMIAYVSVGVGLVTLRRLDPKYHSALLLGLVLPTGAVVSSAIATALPALKLSAANPEVQAALNKAVYWSSLQGLGNGFLFLVLVVAAIVVEMIDRRFNHAAIWCLIAAAFSWVGLLHSATLNWGGQPMYTIGWLAAAFIVFTARWWRGDIEDAAANSGK